MKTRRRITVEVPTGVPTTAYNIKIKGSQKQDIQKAFRLSGVGWATWVSEALDSFFALEAQDRNELLSDGAIKAGDACLSFRVERKDLDRVVKLSHLYECSIRAVFTAALYRYALVVELD